MTTPWPAIEPYTVDTWPIGTTYDGEIDCQICDQTLYSPTEADDPTLIWRTDIAQLRSLVDGHMRLPCRKYTGEIK